MPSEKDELNSIDDFVAFEYNHETYQTFYRVIGDLTKGRQPPVIVLHGGPGLVHNYLLPFFDLSTKYDIPVILYDQIGNGRSTHLSKKPPSFWTIDLFLDELVNLINHLAIQDGFDIVGHSWGGMLACEFEVRRQPSGLRRMVLSNAAADMGLRRRSSAQLIEPFSDDIKRSLIAGLREDREKYFRALRAFYAVHCCTVQPFPPEFEYSLNQAFGPEGDPTVASSRMLSQWTIIDRLQRVRIPTLLINGRKDFVQDFTVQPFFDNIENVRWTTFYNSSHSPFYEDRARYFELIRDFLA